MRTFLFDDRCSPPDSIAHALTIAARQTRVEMITNASAEFRAAHAASCAFIDLAGLSGYGPVTALFDSLYTHLSVNPPDYERCCFHRWFAYDLATADLHPDEYLCVLDSDQGLFINPDALLDLCGSRGQDPRPELVSWFETDKVDGHFIAVGPALTLLTKRCLRAFCLYLLCEFYALINRPQLHRLYYESLFMEHGSSVSDMTALACFAAKAEFSLFNLEALCLPIQNVFCCENYLYFFTPLLGGGGAQELAGARFEKQGAQLTMSTEAGRTRVLGLHFQGMAKPLLQFFAAVDDRAFTVAELNQVLLGQQL